MECIVVGVDGGASKSTFLAFDASRLEASRWRGGPLNVMYWSTEELANRLRRGVWSSLRLLGRRDVKGVYAGLAGMDAGRASIRKAKALEEAVPYPVIVDHDAFVAWWASWIEGGEGVVIAGTGSLVYRYDPETGRRLMLGNHGPLLGDQGSAFEVGFEALKRLGEALQGLSRYTCLEAAVESRIGASTAEDASAWAYAAAGLVEAAAEAARAVVDAAEAGCGEAAALLRRAALRLARLVSRAAEEWDVRVFRVYGGLTRSSVYVDSLKAGVRETAVEEGMLDPVVGAIWLALQYYCDYLTIAPGDLASVLSNLNAEPVEVV